MTDVERLSLMGDRILVRADKPEERSRGGIWIPDNAKKPTGTGIVARIGPGMRTKDGGRWPMPDVRPGNRVIFDAQEHWPSVKIGDVTYLQLRGDAVLAVFEE